MWLRGKNDSIDLKTDDSACVLVLYRSAHGKLLVHWKERQRSQYGYSISDQTTELKELPAKALVRLIDGKMNLLIAPVEIDITRFYPAQSL